MNRSDVLLCERAEGGEEFEVVVEAGANGPFGRFRGPHAFGGVELAAVNEDVVRFYYDAWTLIENARVQGDSSPWRARVTRVASKAVDEFDYQAADDEAVNESARRAREALRELDGCAAARSWPRAVAVGHAHIDVAWLWPLAETVRKCARTFGNQLRLMEEYDEFVFVQSQAQLYEYTRERYPELYERIKKAFARGQWELTGGMWIESDCNLVSGESMIRQFLLGQKLFREDFGAEPETVWLPDVFGYAGSLPQIFRRCGMKHFLTQKLCWSNYTQFPHHTFQWEGIDGTRILTHFPPANTYNGNCRPEQMLRQVEAYAERDRCPALLYVYGFGDGGGGPTREMLELLRRQKDVEGLPRATCGKAADFFRELEEGSSDLPVWRGELYLEFHRGTYTTQARVKRDNRRAELLLRSAEMLRAFAGLPQKPLEEAWKTALRNQFHDVLPGSSIPWVYQDSRAEFARARSIARKAKDQAVRKLFGESGDVVVFNPLSWGRTGVVALPGKGAKGYLCRGEPACVQKVEGGMLLEARDIPSCGYAAFKPTSAEVEFPNELTAEERLLENRFFRVEFDSDGLISRILDKRAGREVSLEGARGNALELYEDLPANPDAWDIEEQHRTMGRVVRELDEARVVERGPLRAKLRQLRRFSRSRAEQDVVLYRDVPRIDFVTRVDWRERRRLLKVAFPVAVNSEFATYEIPFGCIRRPTHTNTLADRAMFEVPARFWADLSEEGYGVALLNDCKYGYDVHGNVMRLSLLRATTHPDPAADLGEHVFTYSLLPHEGNFARGGVVYAGHELNCSLEVYGGSPGRSERSFVSVEPPSLIVSAVKPAEDGSGVVVRLYEPHGARGEVELTLDGDCSRAVLCDCLEREEKELRLEGGSVRLAFRPFEIVTMKFC